MSVFLHKKFGVNPTMTQCYYCNESSEILLVGANTKPFKDAGLASSDGEMQMSIGVINDRPCPKCEGYMKQGVILISIRDGEETEMEKAHEEERLPNPYRTGGWVVVKDDVIRRMIHPESLVSSVLKKRMCFIPDGVWDAIGLPRTPTKEGR